MLKFFHCVFFYAGLLSLCNGVECHDLTTANSPNLTEELYPIPGWDRYSGDSARSFSGWFRWWSYLQMKEPTIIDWIYGLKLKIYPGNEIFRAIFVRGIYDPNLIVVVNTFLKNGSVFIDVGANMGYFSLLASKTVGKNGKVFALEPSSRDFGRLQDNVKINGLQNIYPLRLAVSGKVGPIKLLVACEERSALNTTGSEFSFKGVEKVDVEEVDSTTIDRFVRKHYTNGRLDFLKLDIEGSEACALHGAINAIKKYRPAIMLGVNPVALKACGSTVEELQEILKSVEYKVYEIVETPVFALKEVENMSKTHVKVVICLHKNVAPPALPQPKKQSITGWILDFFLR